VTNSLVDAHSPLEFFKEQVEAACERQRLQPQPATSHYIVTLLSDFVRLEGTAAGEAMASNEALGITLMRALQSAGRSQRRGLKQVGDVSLFVSGFFSDSLRRSLVDIDYYMTLGGHAYGSLGATDDALSATFAELSDKFVAFADVLADVSGQTSLTSDGDLLRLYERWVRTGSRRNGELLAERGIVPNASIVAGSRRIQ
jgi:hypothetical protein